MQSDGSAGKVLDRLSEVEALADELVDVVERVEPRERQGAKQYLDDFIEDWVERAERADEESKLLYYKPNGKGQINLIQQFNTKAAAGRRSARCATSTWSRSSRSRAGRRRGAKGD